MNDCIKFCFCIILFSLSWNGVVVEAQPAPPSNPTLTMVKETLAPAFTPPPPGSYQLPPIDTVTDHTLLDSTGQPINLFEVTQDKVTVISFIYTSCADVGGCPLAATVLQRIDRMLSERPSLRDHVTLVSVSFDPERDTPARMAATRQVLAPQTDWLFLTSLSATTIQPMLTDFNQPVAKLWQADGVWSGLYRHVLKVFLLDPQHHVRNIYSLGFLNPQLVMNDIETLWMETQQHTGSIP